MMRMYESLTVRDAAAGFPAAAARLDALARLAPGWGRHGSRAISPDAIGAARRLLGAVAAHPRTAHAEPYFVAPLPDGGVQLEWRGGGSIVEVAVFPDGTLACLVADDAGCCRAYGDADTSDVNEVLVRIAALSAAC